MFVIANNISTRRAEINNLFNRIKEFDWNPECVAVETLKDIARRCVKAGAEAIEVNIQQHFDYPEAMAIAITSIQQVTDKRLVLSSNNLESLKSGLALCKTPPIINYVSIDEASIADMLITVAKFNAEVILLVSDPAKPSNLDEMLGRTGVLIGMANRMGIPDKHIIIDPGLYHITQGYGQQHLVDAMDFIQGLTDSFNPHLRTTCWLSNASAGVSSRLRPVIDTSLLAMLSAKGLSSVFIDVLRKENLRALRLLKVLRNEMVYAESELILSPGNPGQDEKV